jgi:crotonobetainyl-CoA:carnitine CoA-transferase CaiB-like acyl-CoA transferase
VKKGDEPMRALDGIRVVDLSQQRTGAQASQVLADFGADVVWVEPPGGSSLREGPAFEFYARGKQSIELDLKDAADQSIARDLAASSDVLIESFRPGVTERLGLGFDALQALNPRLVYASITGFGREGPLSHVKGYEALVQAKLGVFSTFRGMARGEPRPPFVSTPWCSYPATQMALQGILSALIEREHSGRGQRVDANLVQGFAALDTWAWFIDLIVSRYPEGFTPSDAYGDKGIPMSPIAYMLLVAPTKDGRFLQFAQVAPRLFLAMIHELGLDYMWTDPDWKGMPLFEDDERRLALWEKMIEAVGSKTLAEWEAVFEANPDVFAESFRAGADVLDHPQLVEGGYVVEAGGVRQPGPLVRVLSGGAAQTDRPPPELDAHDQLPPAPAREALADAAPTLPLEGVTVVELAVMYAAPYGATLLTDLGARVIKVEPLTGDPIRTIMPFPESGGAKVMQGKESICIDINTPDGKKLLYDLVSRADIVLQGYRSGVAERIGVDDATLREVNPNLVYLSASGYGDGGPDGHRPAFAPSIGAASGIARANVGDNVSETPGLSMDEIRAASIKLASGCTIVQAQADGFAAVSVATSILLGLLGRERGGGGQTLSASMLASAAYAMADHVVGDGSRAVHPGPEMRGPSARYRIYDASDGWVLLAAPAASDWADLVKGLSAYVDLAADERFATEEGRTANDDALIEVLTGVFATRGKDEWEHEMTAADVGCVAVATDPIERFLQSEDVGRASGWIVDVEHPTFGEHPRLAPLVRFSRSLTQAKPGGLAGTETDSLLTELGLNDDAIADLRARAVVA